MGLDELAYNVLDSREMDQFERPFDELEIRQILKCMVGDKASRLDGFLIAFFQK